jgi:hypothetical protein
MEASTFLGFIGIVGVGIGFLVLLMTWLDPERPVAVKETVVQAPAGARVAESMAAAVPAFFARPHAGHAVSAILVSDEGLFAVLQSHVRAEQAIVREFVHLPSVDSLYRQAQPSLTLN